MADGQQFSRSTIQHNQFIEARNALGDLSDDEPGNKRELRRVVAAGLDALISLSPHDLDQLSVDAALNLQREVADIADGRPLTRSFVQDFSQLVMSQLQSLRARGYASGTRQVRRQFFEYEAIVADLVDVDRIRIVESEKSARLQSSTDFSNKASEEAKREARIADFLRLLAGTLLLAGFVTALLLSGREQGPQVDALTSLLQWATRALLALPLLLLVGYLARESAQHRHVSRELNFKSIQMQSASDFAAGLTDDQQRSLFLADLGKAMFASSFNQPGKDAQAGLPGDQLNSHLDRFTELAKALNVRR